VRIVYLLRGKACSALALAGALLIFLGGFLQAAWKLIYTSGAADLRLIGNLQFVLMAPGFVALLAAVILLARRTSKKTTPPLLALAPWKLPFFIVMTLASLAAQGLLAYLAFHRRAYGAAAGFLIAFVCLLAMGGMAGGEQSVSRQWVEEIVNAFGQIAFAIGSVMLYRNYKEHAC